MPSHFSAGWNKSKAEIADTSANALIQSLKVLEKVADSIPVVGLKPAVSGILQIITAVKNTKQNADNIRELTRHLETLEKSVLNQGKPLPASTAERVERLCKSILEITNAVNKSSARKWIVRAINNEDDVDFIKRKVQSLTWLMQDFMLEELVGIDVAIQETGNRIASHIDRGHEAILTELSGLNIPRAREARWDSGGPRNSCLDGTRVDLLNEIRGWITISETAGAGSSTVSSSSSQPNVETHIEQPQIFWLSGLAGTGKSTVAQSVAMWCSRNNFLGASFFFLREDANRGSPKLLFSTIAYQLAMFHPPLKPLISKAIERDPDIFYTDLTNQLQKLIVNPVKFLGPSFPSPTVVVIDALDECKDDSTLSTVLSILSAYISDLRLKIFITSRPEIHIRRAFDSSDLRLSRSTRSYILHEIKSNLVEKDIITFLRSAFSRTETIYPQLRGAQWIKEADIKALAALCEGLFIFASTAVQFIEDRNFDDPASRLLSLLEADATNKSSNLELYHSLDFLYAQILREAFPKSSNAAKFVRFRTVVGAIVLLNDRLSRRDLATFLGIEESVVANTLQHLHSVLVIPESTGTIRLLHASFSDFLTQPSRCKEADFLIDSPTQHRFLASRCFHHLKALRKNICGLVDVSRFNSEVRELQNLIHTHIPSALQYACRFWGDHLSEASLSDALIEDVQSFSLESSLFWLEALSLLGCLEMAIPSLKLAQKALSDMQEPPKVTLDMLQDVYKFTLEFFTPISTAALHIYHSAIPFTPRSSLIRQRVGVVDMNGIVAVTNGAEQVWTRCLRVLEGHAYGISSVALSSDGRLVASGSGSNDGAVVQFWDTVTGVNLRTLPSDSPINSLDFSPDSKLLISGSSDFTVRLWDAVTGTVLNQIKGHVGRVRSVAFSPSGRRLISGSDDCTIRVWDAAVGTALKLIVNQSAVGSAKFDHSEESIVAHFEHDSAVRQFDLASGDIVKTMTSASGSIRAVTLSYDGKLIISASAHTIQVWDAITGAALKSIKGPSSFISLGFAPSGKFFASGDHDSNIRVWDVRRGANLKTFEGHMGAVTSVAFSPNEQVLVSSSDDRTIRFWDAANNATVTRRTLNAHKYRVNCIALSPDGKLIASASDDQTIKTWDAVSGAVLKAIKGHTAGVNAVSFSPDNKLLVSGSADGTLRLWNAVTGVAIRIVNVKPRGTGSEISAVAFSPGGKYIISGGMGYIVRMWDVSTTTGHHFRSYSTNASHVHCVSFSSDGALIIAGCSDNALYSWDVRTGDAIKIFRGHSDAVNLATFSPDMRLVISRSWDNTIRLWDRVTGDLVKTFKTYGDSTTLIEQTNPDPANTTRRNDQNIRNADDWVGYTCGSDGWVVRMTETEARRICWIPKAARPDEHHRSLSVFNGNKFAFATASNVVVLLDFSTV